MACLQNGKSILRRSTMHHLPLFAVQGVRYRKLEVILTTIYEPKEAEEVKVVSKTEEISMKEYEAAVKRLAKPKLSIRRFIIEGEGLELREPVTKEQILVEERYIQLKMEHDGQTRDQAMKDNRDSHIWTKATNKEDSLVKQM